MQISTNFLATHHPIIVQQLNAQLSTFPGIQLKEKFRYSPEKEFLSGVLELDGEKKYVHYTKDDGATEESFRDAVNLDLATLFYSSLPQDKRQTDLIIEFKNTSMKEVEIAITTNDGCYSFLVVDPKDNDLDKRIYDFATGMLNIGLIEWMFDDSQRVDRLDGSFDIPGTKPRALPPSAALPTPPRPKKLMQMPYINLQIKL